MKSPSQPPPQAGEEFFSASTGLGADFIQEFCLPDGAIDWHKLVAFNSSKIPRG
ncbi:hypothetical protein [Thiomonas sp.]